jgi:glycosyl hydrolase family 130 (putative beta-1,4-mannooligosaccharide phosphorylase)
VDSRSATATALSAATGEQDGNVPNVVYSCGALVHADTLVLPYGISDAAIGIATRTAIRTPCRTRRLTPPLAA